MKINGNTPGTTDTDKGCQPLGHLLSPIPKPTVSSVNPLPPHGLRAYAALRPGHS